MTQPEEWQALTFLRRASSDPVCLVGRREERISSFSRQRSFSDRVRAMSEEMTTRRRRGNRPSISEKTSEFFQESLHSFGNLFFIDESDDDDDDCEGRGPEEDSATRLQEPLRRLSYTTEDVVTLIGDDQEFRKMKHLLRNRGCITNSFLQQHVHLYLRHVKDKRQL